MNSAAISVLTEAGIPGTQAGSLLRHVLASLAAQGPRVQTGLADLGLSPDKVDPAYERTLHIARRLRDAGLDAPRAQAMFGAEGGRAMMALVTGVGRYEELEGP